MGATVAALLGAIIGGALSVLASWLAQRLQTRAQWLAQEIQRRQQLYSEFVQAAARCFGEALQQNEPDAARLAKVYGEIGRMKLQSSDAVIEEANRIAHKILDTYSTGNRTAAEITDFLAHDSVDLFADFGDACRAELARLVPYGLAQEGPSRFRRTPVPDSSSSQQTAR